MITGIVRTSYAKVWEPAPDLSGNMKYSVSLLIPKKDKRGVEALNIAVQDAIEKGIEKGKFSKKNIPLLKLPIRDGDEEIKQGKKDAVYEGMYFINSSSPRAPGIVNAQAQPIMDQDEFYSGCWCRADINFFPFASAGNKGIGVGLNNLMKIKDDDRLGGRLKAEDAFGEFIEADSETEESPFDS